MCSTQRYESMAKMMNKSTYLLSSLPWGTAGAQGRARQILALLLVTAPWGDYWHGLYGRHHRRSGFTDRTPWQWERSAAEGRG